MLDLMCAKYLRVDVTLLAIKGIDTKIKDKSNYAQSSFKKSLRAPSSQKMEKATNNDILAYATFSSTGILGVEEQNMLVTSNAIEGSTNKIKNVIRWEKECNIIHNDALEDDRDDNNDKDGSKREDNDNDKDGCESSESKAYEGAPTVSIPIVLMNDESAQMPSMDKNDNNGDGRKKRKTKKKIIIDNLLSEEIVNIDLGLISSMNSTDSKMKKINLGRASFVISEEVCGSHTMNIPIRCYNNYTSYHCETKNNNPSLIASSSQNKSKSILKKFKKNPLSSSSKNKVSFLNSRNDATVNSFRGDRSREFILSSDAVLQLSVDILHADERNVDEDEQNQVEKFDENNESMKPVTSSKKSLLRSQKENSSISDADNMNGTQTNKIEETRSNANPSNALSKKGVALKAGSTTNVKKKKIDAKESCYDLISSKLMFAIAEPCAKTLTNCSELLCHGLNYHDRIAEDDDSETRDVETMTTAIHDDEARTFCAEDDATFYSYKKCCNRSTTIGDDHDHADFAFGTASYYDCSNKILLGAHEEPAERTSTFETDDCDHDSAKNFKFVQIADSIKYAFVDNDSAQDDTVDNQKAEMLM